MESEYKGTAYGSQVNLQAKRGSSRVSDLLLRLAALSATLVAALVMGLAKETETVPFVLIPGTDPILVSVPAKMRYSSAFLYFVIANAIACFYTVLTLMTTSVRSKGFGTLSLATLISDVVMVGLVSSGTGAAMAVGVLAQKGNSHVGWNKVCNTFEKYCRHAMAAMVVSLVGSIIFILISAISIRNLHRRLRP